MRCSSVCWTILEGIINGIDKPLLQIGFGRYGSIETGLALLLGSMDTLVSESNFTAHQGVIGVTVGTVVSASNQHMGEQGSPGNHEVRLVPLL